MSTSNRTHHQNWGVEALWLELEPLLPGLSIEVLARVDSTNNALLDRVRSQSRQADEQAPFGRRAHDLQPCLLVAEHQSAGRGRMGRTWHSAPGASLTFSLALPLDLVDWSGLSLAVGCAIAQALDPLAPGQTPRLQLKWPNDIWLDERKLGGILIETVSAGNQRIAVIGVGLNIERQPEAAESNFLSGYASLDELDASLSAPEVLRRIAAPLLQAVSGFGEDGFAAWQARYAQRDLLLNREIHAGLLEGVACGVSERGELMLRDPAGRVEPVSSGEVSVRLGSRSAAC